MCSIEALGKRVQKGHALPEINSIVDLGNAFSLKYVLPMGAHDIGKLDGDLEVRFSVEEDTFLPLGETEAEKPGAGELVYVSSHTVKTRRWIWRQSDDGKITEDTKDVFFPIDGFLGKNDGRSWLPGMSWQNSLRRNLAARQNLISPPIIQTQIHYALL